MAYPTRDKLQAFLEANGAWMMKLDEQVVMGRIGLELQHGELTGRSVEDSLEAAKLVLQKQKTESENG